MVSIKNNSGVVVITTESSDVEVDILNYTDSESEDSATSNLQYFNDINTHSTSDDSDYEIDVTGFVSPIRKKQHKKNEYCNIEKNNSKISISELKEVKKNSRKRKLSEKSQDTSSHASVPLKRGKENLSKAGLLNNTEEHKRLKQTTLLNYFSQSNNSKFTKRKKKLVIETIDYEKTSSGKISLERVNTNHFAEKKNIEVSKNTEESNNTKKKISDNLKPMNEKRKNETNLNENTNIHSKLVMNCQSCKKTNKTIQKEAKNCRKCKEKMKYMCQKCKYLCVTYSGAVKHVLETCSNLYTCDYCGYKSRNKSYILKHIQRQHSEQGPQLVECPTCNMTYKGEHNLKKHQMICGLPPHLFCTFCDYKSKFKKHLATHMKRYHSNNFKSDKKFNKIMESILEKGKTFIDDARKTFLNNTQTPEKSSRKLYAVFHVNRYCKKCDKIYDPKGQNKIKNCPKCKAAFVFECKGCLKRTSSYNAMYNHVIYRCFPRKVLKCDSCNFTTTVKQTLLDHKNYLHSNIDPKDYHVCSKCDKHFKLLKALKHHEKQCKNETPFSCNKCSYETTYKPMFLRHMQTHLLDKEESDVANDSSQEQVINTKEDEINSLFAEIRKWMMNYCINCEKSSQLKMRRKKCENCKQILSFRCGKCNLNCSTIRRLQQHVRSCHLRNTLAQCPKCRICYLKYSRFKSHRDKCKKTAPLKCDQCKYKTMNKHSLKKHKLLHEKTDPVKCDKCGKFFKHLNVVQKHRRYCNETPNFYCDHCPYDTYEKANMTRHMLSKHVEIYTDRSLECEVCGIKILNIYLLEQHIAKCGKS